MGGRKTLFLLILIMNAVSLTVTGITIWLLYQAAFDAQSVRLADAIDLAELRRPFIRAAVVALVVGGFVVLLGSALFVHTTNPMIRAMVQEIADRKRAEQALRDSENRVRAIVDTAVDGIITINESGIIDSVNPAAERMFGYRAEELVGHPIQLLMPAPDRDRHDQYVSRYVATGEKKIIGIGREVMGRHKDGTSFPIDLAVSEVHLKDRRLFTGIVRDISERKKAESLVRRLAAIVESSDDGIIGLALDGTVETWNKGAERIYGYRAEEVTGKPSAILIPPERGAELSEIIRKVKRGESIDHFESTRIAKDGTRIEVLVTASPIKDANGTIVGVSEIDRNIAELKEAQRRLVQSERLAAMGQMLSVIAHESRNTLQRVQASTEMLRLDLENRPALLEELARIERAVLNLGTLFEELRGYAGPIHLVRTTCSLADVWRRAWSSLVPLRESRKVQLIEEPNQVDPHCWVDEFRMEQVFRNLLENSLAACHDPAHIVVTTSESVLEGAAAIRVCVRDNGPGLSEEAKKRVFEAFYTTKSKGTGLGMAIAHRIVEAHGGRIEVGSCAEGGAEFLITLPRGLDEASLASDLRCSPTSEVYPRQTTAASPPRD